MLIITGTSNEKTNELKKEIMKKRHNILPTGTSSFVLTAGKIESVQEFKTKLFE